MSSSSSGIPSVPYKLFIWGTGTTGKDPQHDAVASLSIVEYSSASNSVTHLSTPVALRGAPAVKHDDSGAPPFATAWEEFLCFVDKYSEGAKPLLVSHNASFNVSFLKAELDREGTQVSSNWSFACSLQLARALRIPSASFSQNDLAGHFGIFADREHHAKPDVLLLRDILLAMSDEYSIMPLLYRDAEQLQFFDRIPESVVEEEPETTTFVTLTGRKYHAKGCKWLSRSCIPKRMPPPGLEPCSTCEPSPALTGNRPAMPSLSETSHTTQTAPKLTLSSPCSEVRTVEKYFITKSGSKYHVDGCTHIRRSKIPKDSPPAGYAPCRVCLPNGVRTKGSSPDFSSTRRQSSVSSSSRFYTTKTGRKFHIATCKHLRKSKFAADPPPAGYEPCAVCLPCGMDSNTLGTNRAERAEKVNKLASFAKKETSTIETPLCSKKSCTGERDSMGSPRSALDFGAQF